MFLGFNLSLTSGMVDKFNVTIYWVEKKILSYFVQYNVFLLPEDVVQGNFMTKMHT